MLGKNMGRSAAEALNRLCQGNQRYVEEQALLGDVSLKRREQTAKEGQHPYAVVVTCSDSRVPAEHIFSAGVGDIFVIRTAGNVVGDFELGSIEYGAEHCSAPLIVVLGHTGCGAVAAALEGGAEGNIKAILDEITPALQGETDARICEKLNMRNSMQKVKKSSCIARLMDENKVCVVGAIYDTHTGLVTFEEE